MRKDFRAGPTKLKYSLIYLTFTSTALWIEWFVHSDVNVLLSYLVEISNEMSRNSQYTATVLGQKAKRNKTRNLL